ncbi:MAG: carbohydrate-binding protein [Chitinophagaceae bacterium]|nr:MAG: carbohydrate-binding protein [Chitinophagaceae bacterium]
MRKIAVVMFLIVFKYAYGQEFLKTSGQKIVNGKGENILLRGMGLGGWMLQEGYMLGINKEGQQYRIKERIDSLIGKEKSEEFYAAWLDNHTTKKDIDSLKSWGFNSVRLPMHYNLYTLPVEQEPQAGKHTWLNRGFAITDSLISWCKANKIYLILDLHAAPGGQGNDNNIADRNPERPSLWDSDANQQKTIALWKKLAERYKNESTVIAYDIINEPNWGFEDVKDKNGLEEKSNAPLEKLLRNITTAIRSVDTNHIIIIEGNGWGNNYSGILDDGVWDKNMVLSFHKYWNYNNKESIASILALRQKYNVPVWLGETGENSNTWFTRAIQLLESNNIGWAWWPLKKLGHNNPLQIPRNEQYNQIVNYWNGETNTLPKVDIYSALMSLAKNTNIDRNIFHVDVVDAMMRQPHDNNTLPFKKQAIQPGVVLKAADYDLGKNGFAYYDLDTANYRVSGKPGIGNKGHTYRNDGVDIFRENSAEDIYVGSFEAGEWLKYSIDVASPGTYHLALELASRDSAVLTINLSGTGKFTSSTVHVPNTGAEDKWVKVASTPLTLNPGRQTLTIKATAGSFSLKEIKFLEGKLFNKIKLQR